MNYIHFISQNSEYVLIELFKKTGKQGFLHVQIAYT